MIVSRFRLMRLHCHIPMKEVAALANISTQRLNQFETRYYGARLRNPERLTNALETVIAKRKEEIEKVEYILQHEKDTIFKYIEASEGI